MIQCSICLEEICQDNLRLSCNHKFHKLCITKLIKYKQNKCPLCKRYIKNTKITCNTNLLNIIDDNLFFHIFMNTFIILWIIIIVILSYQCRNKIILTHKL